MIFRETQLCILAYPPSNITMIQIPRPDSKQEAENYDEDTVKLSRAQLSFYIFIAEQFYFRLLSEECWEEYLTIAK